MEQRNGETEQLLDNELDFVDERVLLGLDLVVELVFAKGEDRDEIGAGADGELDEALAALEHEAEKVRLRVERFASATDNNRYGATHAFAICAASREQVLTGFAGHGGEAEGESVVAVEGDAEVGVEGEKGVCYAGEEGGEAESFGAEGREGPMGDDPVGVVAKDIFAG